MAWVSPCGMVTVVRCSCEATTRSPRFTTNRTGATKLPGEPAGPSSARPSTPTLMAIWPPAARHSRAVWPIESCAAQGAAGLLLQRRRAVEDLHGGAVDLLLRQVHRGRHGRAGVFEHVHELEPPDGAEPRARSRRRMCCSRPAGRRPPRRRRGGRGSKQTGTSQSPGGARAAKAGPLPQGATSPHAPDGSRAAASRPGSGQRIEGARETVEGRPGCRCPPQGSGTR